MAIRRFFDAGGPGVGSGGSGATALGRIASRLRADGAERLLRVVEREIVPRLAALEAAAPAPLIGAETEAALLESLLHGSTASTWRIVAGLRRRGVPDETILLEVLPVAARRLGELWDEDLADFAEVTIGLYQLHDVLRKLSSVETAKSPRPAAQRRVLLGTVRADPHILGLTLVAEFFERAGWSVRSEPGSTREELVTALAAEPFDLLGLSVARGIPARALAEEIRRLRLAATRRELRVLVGGRLFLERPGLVAEIGADGVAPDARSAPEAAARLLALPARKNR